MSTEAVEWTIAGDGAKLRCGPLEGAAAFHEGSASFLVARWNCRPVNGLNVLSYFGASFQAEPLRLAETYVRSGDFVATFAEAGESRIAPQLYWRAAFVERLQAAKLELVISVKTALLDSRPAARTHSMLNLDAKVFHSSSLGTPRFEALGKELANITLDGSHSREHLFVFRMPEHGLTFAELVHPTDFVSAELGLDAAPPYSLLASLFPERLEKGVIRRGRICGWFMPCENDLETAVALARDFVEEPLPLTA